VRGLNYWNGVLAVEPSLIEWNALECWSKSMEQRAIENGILDKAYENAKEIIEKLVNNDVVQEQGYTIIFEVIG